jgi:hypothetical protein
MIKTTTVISGTNTGQIAMWDEATQSYQPAVIKPYVLNILITDWIISGNTASITILGAVHGKGTSPKIETYETVGSDSVKNECDISVNNTTGDVTISITNTTQFDGKIVIS